MNQRDHIESDEKILLAIAVVKGTRLSVKHIIKLFASGLAEKKI